MRELTKKICMLGDFGVGKTSLIRRFVDRQFSDQYLSTVGAKISKKTIDSYPPTSADPYRVKLMIWDLEGHTKFKAVAPSHLQGAAGVLLVGDVTRQETLQNLAFHLEDYLRINPEGIVAIAFNKGDLKSEEELNVLHRLYALDHPQVQKVFVTSAKTGDQVDDIFQTLVDAFSRQSSASA